MASKHIPYQVAGLQSRYEQRWKVIVIEDLKRQLAGGRVLDYGCGRGETLELLVGAGYEAFGVDIDPECVKLASRHAPARVVRDIRELEREQFDAALVLHVLEHLRDPVGFVLELQKRARLLYLAVPNPAAFGRYSTFRLRDYVNRGHVQAWDHAHFKVFVEEHCGLQIDGWLPDRVIIPKLTGVLDRLSLGKIEETVLTRIFAYRSNSVIARCVPRRQDPD